MTDPAAEMRHEQHKDLFDKHETRITDLETEATDARHWREGNGEPERGARKRLSKVEENAVMIVDVDKIATAAVKVYLRSVRGAFTAYAPWVFIAAGLVYWAVTGKPLPQLPTGAP